MTEPPKLAGFLSYARHDDEHEHGRITRLVEPLQRGIRFYSGIREVDVFLDVRTIGWGQSWRRRIIEGLDGALLLFPVVTPSFFTSEVCLDELEAFQARETALGRDDLILPIYYIRCPALEMADPPGLTERARRAATLLRERNHQDWRRLRRTPEADPTYLHALDSLAEKAVPALLRAASATPRWAIPPPRAATAAQTASTMQAEAAAKGAPAATSREVPIVVVDPYPGRGDFSTIGAAIKGAPPGARILIRPGHYPESLAMNRPLELVGEGEAADIVVEGITSATLRFDTNMGAVRNLTLRQRGANNYCVWITQGRLELEGCDISSAGLSCVAVSNSADPRLRRNRIHGGKQGGIFVYEAGRGTFEDNDIVGNAFSGIAVRDGSDPVVRRNRIHGGKTGGISVHAAGRGTFEDNDIVGNVYAGIDVKDGGDPVVRRNRIHGGKQAGIHVHTAGRGTFEDNDIVGNAYAGIEVKTEGNPVVRRNRIAKNGYQGVWVWSGGRGTYEANDLRENIRGAWKIEAGAQIERRDNIEQ